VDNFVEVGACRTCHFDTPRNLLVRNAGLCFRCACAHQYEGDHRYHAELERADPRPTIPQGR
jgi:hypothetical protein